MITKIISEKKLFWVSFAVVGYFCLLYLNAYFVTSDLVFIGWSRTANDTIYTFSVYTFDHINFTLY